MSDLQCFVGFCLCWLLGVGLAAWFSTYWRARGQRAQGRSAGLIANEQQLFRFLESDSHAAAGICIARYLDFDCIVAIGDNGLMFAPFIEGLPEPPGGAILRYPFTTDAFYRHARVQQLQAVSLTSWLEHGGPLTGLDQRDVVLSYSDLYPND